jgi:hypothetical protein
MNFYSKTKPVLATPISAPKRRPHITLSGRNLAHASRGCAERAYLAAAWIRGGLTISRPTVALAARVFHANGGAINDALDAFAGTETTSAFGNIWVAMTPNERADFFRGHLTEVWTALPDNNAASPMAAALHPS